LAFASWIPYVIDPNTLTVDNTTGSPSGSERWVGILATLPTTSGPTKGNPIAIDAIRYGRCDVEYTNGDLGNGYNTFSGAEAYANADTRRWGLIQLEGGAYLIQGFHSFGTSGTAVDFRDANKVLFWRASGNNNLTNDSVSTAFNRIEILNASSNVDWDNITIQALGTRAKGVFVHTAGAFEALNCQFVDMDTFTFISTSVLTGTVFRRCALVTVGTGAFTDCQFINSTASASAITADLEDLTGCYFESDGSNHAVELTSIGGGSMDWDNTLSGYVAGAAGSPASTSSTGNEAIYVNVGSGTLTINVQTGASVPSIRTAGATVNVVAGAVPLLVKTQDISGTVIENVRVLVEAGAGGAFPSDASVTITRSATTATVAHTAHGLSNGDKVVIRGAIQNEYNGLRTISNVSTNAYDYTVSGSPTTPATGTITSTFSLLDGLTNASGEITATRTYSVNTPLSSRSKARKSSSSPYYKTGSIVGTINKDTGLSVTVIMLSDE